MSDCDWFPSPTADHNASLNLKGSDRLPKKVVKSKVQYLYDVEKS